MTSCIITLDNYSLGESAETVLGMAMSITPGRCDDLVTFEL